MEKEGITLNEIAEIEKLPCHIQLTPLPSFQHHQYWRNRNLGWLYNVNVNTAANILGVYAASITRVEDIGNTAHINTV